MAKKKAKSKGGSGGDKTPSSSSKTKQIEDVKISQIEAPSSSLNQTATMNLCRLCEAKDGPFLYIFDPETDTGMKIDKLMPFQISVTDDLPQFICFRCSAKVEELYEFVNKCIKSQENLRQALGKKESLALRTKNRKIWEYGLKRTSMTNDDYCNALIEKAIEGLRSEKQSVGDVDSPSHSKDDTQKPISIENCVPVKAELKNFELKLEKCDHLVYSTRITRSKNTNDKSDVINQSNENLDKSLKKQHYKSEIRDSDDEIVIKKKSKQDKKSSEDSDECVEVKVEKKVDLKGKDCTEKTKTVDKPFNIMHHVSIIKVNGVGVLFQCKLCNRNFLSKEVVLSHGCAKNGVPKENIAKPFVPIEIPNRVATVKYINTKTNNNITKAAEASEPETKPIPENKPVTESKPKLKIGPASKIKRNIDPSVGMVITPREPTPPPSQPLSFPVQAAMPFLPNLQTRFKLVPGPNNSFTLMEDRSDVDNPKNESVASDCIPNITITKNNPKNVQNVPKLSTDYKTVKSDKQIVDTAVIPSGVINREEIKPTPSPPQTVSQPYPVGLFQTLKPHPSTAFQTPPVDPVTFTTPAMKKQSYTIVQTGNPSKLLISTKPVPPMEEPTKKRQRKSKQDDTPAKNNQPFKVTLENSAPSQDTGFFTFINVDPLLQPSYVLPTDTVIQESRISTSTVAPSIPPVAEKTDKDIKDKYSCNMCEEKFTREKKLLAHIQSHYAQMDEEDQLRSEKIVRKRTRRS